MESKLKVFSLFFWVWGAFDYLPVAPLIAPFSFGDDEALNAGDFVVVQCSAVKGDSPLSLRWAFQSRPLSPDTQAQSVTGLTVSGLGDRISVLSIQSVSAAHNGEYTCTAENAAGVANYTATLTVNGTFWGPFFVCDPFRNPSLSAPRVPL